MEVASDTYIWPVVLTITLARELYQLAPNDAQKRNLGVWEGEGVCLLENRTVSKVLLMLPIAQGEGRVGTFYGRFRLFVIKY